MQKTILLALTFLTLHLAKVTAQNIPYSDCPGCWNADSLGNHRVVLRFNGPGAVAKAVLPWRRRDLHPEQIRIIVQDSATGALVRNSMSKAVSRESGTVYFEPVSGKGLYYIYYMPYRNEGRSNYPKGVYWKPDSTANSFTPNPDIANRTSINPGHAISGHPNTSNPSPAGRPNITAASPAGIAAVPANCTVIAFQSIDSFDRSDPMEVIATANETKALTTKYKEKPFLVFPEDRLHSIRMTADLPLRWIQKGPATSLTGSADKGEYFTWQLGIYALRQLNDIQVVFSDLVAAQNSSSSAVGSFGSSSGGSQLSRISTIPAANLSCINLSGTTYDGKLLTKKVEVSPATIQALWCGVDIPANSTPGTYTGTVKVIAKGFPPQSIKIAIKVSATIAKDTGAGEPWKMTRLKWLNSTLGQENTVIAPYTPITVTGDSLISLLGRRIKLNSQGFPEQIQTFFTPEMTDTSTEANNLLAENIHFHFTRQADSKDIRLKSDGLHFTTRTPGTLQWQAINTSDEIQMNLSASLEFDGSLQYIIKVIALQDLDLKDITMHIPFQPELAKYMMGLGLKGGNRPDSIYQWKWDVAHKNQDGAWIGAVNAGLQYSLRDEHYIRPLNTNFYLRKPLLLPTSWGNEGKGGISVGIKGRSMLANNYTGPRQMKKGDTLYYNFNLLITPFHTINTDFQWATRFYHKFDDLDSIKATGATVVNIHHATPINPWINYPFIEWKKMKDYIDKAHMLGLKVKIYNTVRELSDHAYETFALRSLGHEIYSPGPGGGFSWLQEHIGNDYIAAWFVPEIKDAALVNSGMSRWHNYYVEGMNWLVQHTGIDGIYLDDVAFDRITMKRIKRMLTQDGHPGIIDLHSANQYNRSDGFNNSGNLYMEHFPYLNRLWFGEYFDYEKNSPDFFLTEVSGIPFGLMGEMLEGGGNPWRGMIYGMTNRMPWSDNADPRPIWHVWDAFGMAGTKMIGYWSPSCPVRTSDAKVLATVYLKKGTSLQQGAMLVSLASWADQDTTVQLKIDWKAIGLDPAHVSIQAPGITNFQSSRVFHTDEAIPVPKGKGWLLVIK